MTAQKSGNSRDSAAVGARRIGSAAASVNAAPQTGFCPSRRAASNPRRSRWFQSLTSATILCLCGLLWGCLPDGGRGTVAGPPPPGEKAFFIVTTTAMAADLVRAVAGERAEVITLIGEGVDPHLYRPTTRDTAQLMLADVVFYSGLHLEGAMQTALERAGRRGHVVSAVTAALPDEALLHPDDFGGHPDPHVWGDVRLWAQCLDHIVDVLSEFDPSEADAYQARGRAHRSQLEQLDQDVRAAIATIPPDRRTLVTAHDAFGYFSRAYGLEVRTLQGVSTESEPGVQDVVQLVDELVQRRTPAIFVEATVNPGNLQAVIEGAARRGWRVRIGGDLFSDSMGRPHTYEGTYIGMIDHNVSTIVHSLGGTIAPRGLRGRLTTPLSE